MTDQAAAEVFPDTPIRPPFDRELEPVLAATLQAHPRLSDEMLDLRRRQAVEERSADLTANGAVSVEELLVPGPDGGSEVELLILRPTLAGGPLPGIFYIHGGGMVFGDRYNVIDPWLPYVADGSAVVISVEYRLAPEHPDPAPVEDCYAGLVWTAANAAQLGIDPKRLLIAGLSAGGGLAAGTALLARDRGFPELTHQVLICPMLDDRLETPSSRMLDGEGTWDRNDNLYGWTALLGERRGGLDVSPYAAPARATDLAGLPRTYLDTGSTETFRDEILDFAGRLSQAGVSVDLHLWGGGFHAFDHGAPHAPISRAAIATRDEFIRRALQS